MKISTKGRYALRLMLDIAMHAQRGRCVLRMLLRDRRSQISIWNRSYRSE